MRNIQRFFQRAGAFLRRPSRKAWSFLVGRKLYNFFIDLQKTPDADHPAWTELAEIRHRAQTRTDISDHLPTLFLESVSARPKLIVELGVRGGESTFVFERTAKLCGAKLVSVDIDPCEKSSTYPDWTFVQQDDIAFAGRFPEWCRERGLEPRIDVLFIDTSHLYEHTAREIAAYFPFLSDGARVFFHDTNMGEVFFRKDGSVGFAWDNERGVIRAVEERFKTTFDETKDFIEYRDGWLIRHFAHCNGLTILERIK